MSVLTCPVCQGAMREVNREGILIDVCTQCRGVWLDRGELEKLAGIMGRGVQSGGFLGGAATMPPPQRPMQPPRQAYDGDRGQGHRRDWDDDDDDDRRHGGEYRGDRRQGEYRGDRRKSGVARFLDFFD